MADNDTERLFVQLEARITDFEKRMKKAERTGTDTYNKLRRGSKSATKQMEMDMTRSTARINQALASTSSQIGLFAKSFAIGAIGGGGIAGFTAKVRSVVSELSEMAKVIDRVGLSAKTFQELEYGFSLAGVSQSEFVTGMEQFTKRIGEASMGTGRLREILDANGVSLRDQNGKMKSAETLLREYADLIKNAGSEQERMTLATEAFGRGGAAFVNALKNGAAGFDDMADAAEDAGGVIDDELLKMAEDVDDEWAETSRRFEMNMKRAILGIIEYAYDLSDVIDGIASKMGEIGDSSFFQRLSEWAGTSDAVFVPGEGVISNPSIADRARANNQGSRSGFERLNTSLEAYGASKTVLPNEDDDRDEKRRQRARDAAAKAALREAEAVQKLIDDMAHELSLIGATDAEKAKLNASRRAGSAASDEERRQIEQLAVAIHEETKALEENKKAQKARKESIENLFEMGGDALTSIVDGSMKAEDAIKKLAIQLALAAAQAALLGTGPLAGLLGGGLFGGGGISSIAMSAVMGGAGGLYYNGTANTGGQKGEPRGIVHGQEAVIPLPDGGKVPVQMTGGETGGNATYAPTYNIDASGSTDPEETRRQVKQALKEYDKGNYQRFLANYGNARKRNAL
ncbi:hypothetical protein [uncultured Nitratireductor sp.]|uniref:hypothetical protein n=1 Tax=uncultured Nitratireductor sp. TaxID=520953 RepID=UPI00262AEEA6|nr:hypothetical protein [uncultured Nitratireductor sp.]